MRAAAQASATGEFPGNLPDPRALAPDADALLGPLQRRLVAFGLTQAQALDLSDRVRRRPRRPQPRPRRGRGRAPSGTSATRGQERRRVHRRRRPKRLRALGGAPRRPAGRGQEGRRTNRPAPTARRQREEEKAQAAQAERERGEARDRSLDEAFDALPEAEQDALTARAVARMKAEAPQVHAWYQAELAAGTAEAAMRPSVRSTLRAIRRDLLTARARRPARATASGESGRAGGCPTPNDGAAARRSARRPRAEPLPTVAAPAARRPGLGRSLAVPHGSPVAAGPASPPDVRRSRRAATTRRTCPEDPPLGFGHRPRHVGHAGVIPRR